VLAELAGIALARGEPESARVLLDDALAITDELGLVFDRATVLHSVALLDRAAADVVAAAGALAEAIATRRRAGTKIELLQSLEVAAGVLGDADPAASATLFAATARSREFLGAPAYPRDRARNERDREAARVALGAEAFAAASARGEQLEIDRATDLALDGLGALRACVA
jgi:hypothetical protein